MGGRGRGGKVPARLPMKGGLMYLMLLQSRRQMCFFPLCSVSCIHTRAYANSPMFTRVKISLLPSPTALPASLFRMQDQSQPQDSYPATNLLKPRSQQTAPQPAGSTTCFAKTYTRKTGMLVHSTKSQKQAEDGFVRGADSSVPGLLEDELLEV